MSTTDAGVDDSDQQLASTFAAQMSLQQNGGGAHSDNGGGPPGFVNRSNGEHNDSKGQQGRSRSYNRLVEAVGEGLASNIEDSYAGGNLVNGAYRVGSDAGGLLFSSRGPSQGLGTDLYQQHGGGGELDNFQRQSRYAARRLPRSSSNDIDGITTSLEHLGQFSGRQFVLSNHHDVATTSSMHGGQSGMYSTLDGNGDLSGRIFSQTSIGDGGNDFDGMKSVGIESYVNNTNPNVGLLVKEPFGNDVEDDRLGRLQTGSSGVQINNGSGGIYGSNFGGIYGSNFGGGGMQGAVLKYMQERDGGRGSGTGSAPPNFDVVAPNAAIDPFQNRRVKQTREEADLFTKQSTEVQLAPFLRNPGPGVKPSRCLAILLNCRPTVEKSIRVVCEGFGNLEYFRSEFAVSRGVIFLSYVNLQSAQYAANHLASRLMDQTLVEPRIRFCTEAMGVDETRLLITTNHDIYSPNSNLLLDETTLNQILSSYGPLRSLNQQVFPSGEECFAVEFYDVNDSKQALLELKTMSHPNLPPINISVAPLSSKERKLAKDLIQLTSQWRSGSETAHQFVNGNAPNIHSNMQNVSGPYGTTVNINSRSHSPATTMTLNGSPIPFPPTPPRTPPLMSMPPSGSDSPLNMYGSSSQQQTQTHMLIGPDGQVYYVPVPVSQSHGQMQYDLGGGSAPRAIPTNSYRGGMSSAHMSPHHSPGGSPRGGGFMYPNAYDVGSVCSNETFGSRRSGTRNSRSQDDSNLQLNLQMIKSGQDTRTSLMVKNIPNKYTRTMLLNELKESGFDSMILDFFYLPIDFKNECNRGYAFVNFVAYQDIIPFWEQFNGKQWKIFNSDKICDITYARLQGKASMVKRYEHSALMHKDEEYRPLVFVSSGPNKGHRESFTSVPQSQ